MKIKESGEMYLETILVLSKTSNEIHAVKISEYMNFSKPSVSRALGILRREGYIEINEDDHIFLTPKGKKVAEKMYERHNIISRALIALGVDEKTAEADACKIEHDISDETFCAIKEHFKKI